MILTPLEPWALLLQTNIIDMVSRSTPVGYAVLGILVCLSLISWAIIFSKWSTFRRARGGPNRNRLRSRGQWRDGDLRPADLAGPGVRLHKVGAVRTAEKDAPP